MNIYLSSSGWNLFWQTGVMKSLSYNETFWNRVENIYGISGGSLATIYNYFLPRHDEEYKVFDSWCYWWESFNRRRDTKNMKYIYTHGYKWMETWNYFHPFFNQDIGNKNYFYGISHWNRYGMPLDFKWHHVDINSSKDRIRKSMLSSYAPYFVARPDTRWMKKGMDGWFAYKRERDFPYSKENTLQIISNEKGASKNQPLSIIQDDDKVVKIWKRNLTKTKIKNMYLRGFTAGENFLKNYLPTIS